MQLTNPNPNTMEKLNITQGEWKKHYYGEHGNRQCRIHADNVSIIKVFQIDEADANADLIADAGTTYNSTPLLPSELLKQRNELLEALRVMLDGSNAPEWKKEMALKTIKNCNNA
jgi:hypothetical protein